MNTIKLSTIFPSITTATFLYAVCYTFCFYDNSPGIAQLYFTIATLIYMTTICKQFHITWKRSALPYAIAMVLLSLSTLLTGDETLHFFNSLGIFLLLMCMVLHLFYDDSKWGFLTHTRNLLVTICGSVYHMFHSFLDGYSYAKNTEKSQFKQLLYVVIGLSIGAPIVLIVSALLITSDYVMRSFTRDLLSRIHFDDIMCVIFLTILVFLLVYGYLSYLSKRSLKTSATDIKQSNPLIIMSVLLPLGLLYVIYSVVQILYLFIGNMTLPDGYTYAEYAREGFFQLLLVCAFNILLILVSIAFFQKSKLVTAILTTISGCTYIMLFSSGIRMIMYIRFYYFTYLRVLVLWGLVVLFLLLTGAVVTIYKKNFPLFSYATIVVTLCYLVLSFGRPDSFIARMNSANINEITNDFFVEDAYCDYGYLKSLSTDAYSVVYPLIQDELSEYSLYLIFGSSDSVTRAESMNLRNWNLSRMQARQWLVQEGFVEN